MQSSMPVDIVTLLQCAVVLCVAVSPLLAQQDGDAWIESIRPDHPRLFFNAETWPAVKARALGVEQAHYAKVKAVVDNLPDDPDIRDWGNQLMNAAFVYRVTGDAELLAKVKKMLQASLDFYHGRYAELKMIDWYSTSRVSWLAAFDWVWDDLTPEQRKRFGQSMLKHTWDVQPGEGKPRMQRCNTSGHTTGFYGVRNIVWFAGLVMHNEGIDDEQALAFLNEGQDLYQKLLAHRSALAGDDGGGASSTVTYTFDAYPWCVWNYLHTWRSATGGDMAARWPYITLFPNYVMWNWLPNSLEYGYGDTPHLHNKFPALWMYAHMSQIMHFYGQSHPERSALAAYVRSMAPENRSSSSWSVYPFLTTDLEQAPAPLKPGKLPPSRHFPQMGQVFMRSGPEVDDTYALFACGGSAGGHRHYDAAHFTIYKEGFLALDTGSRHGNTDQLQNYFAQTVAHNCVMIKMPGEEPSPFWNGPVYGQAGGQYKKIGSEVIAFETGPEFTYVAGDATVAYRPEKCSQMVRQLVFVPPDHFVVFDRAVSTQAGYAKRWLLHTANEPVVTGKTFYADQGDGRIFCETLLPGDAELKKIGGPGEEFMADGVNYPLDAPVSEQSAAKGVDPSKKFDEVPELVGRWRMEISPGAARTDDVFLHLIQVGSQDLEHMSEASATIEAGKATVTLLAGGRAVTLSFHATGDVGGHIRIVRGEETLVNRPLTEQVMAQEGLATVR